MANAVVRYLVEEHNIPVYRIFVMGMGNAKVQTAPTASSSKRQATGRPAPNRVEVSLLKNNLDQLAVERRVSRASTTASSTAVRHHTDPPPLQSPLALGEGFFLGSDKWVTSVVVRYVPKPLARAAT